MTLRIAAAGVGWILATALMMPVAVAEPAAPESSARVSSAPESPTQKAPIKGQAAKRPVANGDAAADHPVATHPPIDHSGRKQYGKGSYYAGHLAGKKTATGEAMDPNKMAAASKTLPLGTKAKVTNLENGKSANVEINDRGPYVDGRIVDVTPKVADKLDLKPNGVASVEVKPLEVPQVNGEVKDTSNGPDAPAPVPQKP